MRFHVLLKNSRLPVLLFAGMGAGAAAAALNSEDAAQAISRSATCMFASIPTQVQSPEAMKSYEEAEPPLWDDLGTLAYPVTTTVPEAQAYFDQGLRLTANFNHAEARRSFRKAQRLDPDCAMCFAAEALILGPNINVPMDPAANPAALAAMEKAQVLAGKASAKEQDIIAAIATRYSPDPAAERAALDGAFADAMTAVADKYPDDLALAVLAAEADMDTQPWDYWEPGGAAAKGRTADALGRIEGVLARSPDHPWAIHLYIHLVEASDRPERAEPYADRLAAQMPGAGHIVHMPSHIYYRIGRYVDSLEANKAASAVDEAYISETGAMGVYPMGYYSHNIHFVLVSAQLLGEAETVLAQAEKLDRWLTNEVATAVPIAQPVKAAPYFAWAQYAPPEQVMALPEPPGAPPYVKAMWHYARGAALVGMKDLAGAAAEADAIARLAAETDWSMLDAWGVPARPVLGVAEKVVRARIAQAEGDRAKAIEHWRAAAETEDTIPYMEPPFWYYPVRQSLGAALLNQGDVEAAANEFGAALKHARGSAWALYGLKEAAKARGDAAAEKEAETELVKSWRGDPALLTLDRL
ncbi:hypothetical protein ABGN05_00375 [Aquibium sp. LZ166]|uniref:Tetratricopeptide repeat protein n=1 Tax=Aquibium pacificus TaxID=3153579 RepID=A0ABV3SDH3_9HYPH